jgi:PAS domain S-box-containing protein
MPAITSSIVMLASVAVLVGWQYRIYLLKTIPGQTTVVAPNTAVCFIACSFAILLLLRRRSGASANFGRLLGAAVFIFAGLTLLEYTFGFNFGIDDVFFRHRLTDWPVPTVPGRFAVQTAFGLTCMGLALACTDRRFRFVEVSELFIALASLAPLVGMLGYIYHANQMHGVMAGETILLFILLWIGLALLRPHQGLAQILLAHSSGGVAARRLIFSTGLLLILSGWVRIRLQYLGYTDLELGTALFVTWTLIAVTILILSTSHKLDQLDRQREAATEAVAATLFLKQASEDRLNEGLETANAAIWDMNLQTGELYWSKCHFTLLGYQLDEITPSLDIWRQRVHPDDRQEVENHWAESIRERTPFTCQYRVVWPDGSVHWMETKGKTTYDPDGNPLRSIGGFVDITERKRGQQALMEAEKLAATGRMAATLAHEINNPLAAVTNLIYLLKTSAAESPKVLQQYLQVADDELRRVSQLVQKTLSFYRADVRPTPTNISSLVDDITWLYKKRIRDFGIVIAKHVSFDGQITCNSGEVRQVLTNIFVNAMDAVGSGGKILVHITSARSRHQPSLRGVRVNIYDNGPGIPVEIRRNLFSPFVSMKGDQGTGLGLWISKGIIEKNGGSIRFRTCTTERHGTCFSIFIPDQAAELATQEGHLAQAATSSSGQLS